MRGINSGVWFLGEPFLVFARRWSEGFCWPAIMAPCVLFLVKFVVVLMKKEDFCRWVGLRLKRIK